METAEHWIQRFGLKPHPEGGYYAETYRSNLAIDTCCLGSAYDGRRSACTAIYYMLVGTQFSTMHRLRSDELWCYHLGAPLSIHLLTIEDGHTEITLGTDLEKGHRPQIVVPAGTWFGAKVGNPEAFSLMGCIMAPGFEFSDLEIGEREELIRRFPSQRSIIEELTK